MFAELAYRCSYMFLNGMRSLTFSDIAPGRTRKGFKLFVEKKVGVSAAPKSEVNLLCVHVISLFMSVVDCFKKE